MSEVLRVPEGLEGEAAIHAAVGIRERHEAEAESKWGRRWKGMKRIFWGGGSFAILGTLLIPVAAAETTTAGSTFMWGLVAANYGFVLGHTIAGLYEVITGKKSLLSKKKGE